MVLSPRFCMAVVVSPILLNSVYATVGANPTKLSDFLLAFQNGFFWKSIFGTISHGQGVQAPEGNSGANR